MSEPEKWTGQSARIEVLIDGEWVVKKAHVPTVDFNMEDFTPQTLTPEMMVRRHFVLHYRHKFKDIRVVIEDYECTKVVTHTTVHNLENPDYVE